MTLPVSTAAKPTLPAAVAAMLASAACWGLAIVMTKAALSEIPPFTLLAIQLTASVAFLWLATALLQRPVILDRRAGRAASTGLLEPGLAYGVGVPGIALTTATNASIISAAEPALIVLLAWLLLSQRPSLHLSAGLVAASAGLFVLTLSDARDIGSGALLGDGLVLLGTLFAALYVVASSRFATRIDGLPLAALQQSVGLAAALLFLAVALLLGFEALPSSVSRDMTLLAVASGIIQYALPFWLYLIGLKTLAPGTAGLFLALIPVFGVGGAAVFLGETLGPWQGAGAVLIIGAVVLAARRSS